MKNIALYENSTKPEASKYAEQSARIFKELGTVVYAQQDLIDKFSDDIASYVKPINHNDYERLIDIVISFGGDGTMLSAAQTLINTNIPIMGVNVGKLGFLAEFSILDLDKSIRDLVSGNYRIVDRTVLEATINKEKIYALNDFVIEKKGSSRMITIHTYANEHLVANYRADGLIITTPTGSTAYSLSCGGPIIAPSTEVVCLTPISPHTMTLRPLVIPDSNEITIKINSPTGIANFVADGIVYSILEDDQWVLIKKSEERVKMIKPLKSSYYDLLRAKLLWAANAIDSQEADKKRAEESNH